MPLGATQVREARRLVAFVFVIRARLPPLKGTLLTVLLANYLTRYNVAFKSESLESEGLSNSSNSFDFPIPAHYT